MYSRYKAAILSPKNIPLYTNKKLVTLIYFLILGLIYILPNLLYVIETKGIDYYYFKEVEDEFRDAEINYSIVDNTLIFNKPFQEISTNTANYLSTGTIQINFIDIKETDFETDLSEQFTNIAQLSESPIKIIFTEKRMIGLLSYQGLIVDVDLGTYEEFNVGTLMMNQNNDEKIIEAFINILHAIHFKYEKLILSVSIPTIILAGMIGLAISILIPSFILVIFNRGFGVKFGKIYHMGIYAFTIYVLGSSLLFWNIESTLVLIFEIISFIYLSIAMRSYYSKNIGGFKHEL